MFRLKDQNDRSCPHILCDGVDNYNHARFECKYVETKYKKTFNFNLSEVKDNATFLVELNKERRRKYQVPLIVGHSWGL